MQCKGHTKSGKRCSREAKENGYCYQHQPKEVNYEDMTLEELKDHMTEKQAIFSDEYITTMNATESAIKAGYSKETAYSQGHRLLKNVEIKTYIRKRLKSKEDERIANQDEVLEYLTKVMRGKEEEVDVSIDDTGREREIRQPPAVRDRTKAAELLGKRYAIFVDKQEHQFNEIPTINVVRGGKDGG